MLHDPRGYARPRPNGRSSVPQARAATGLCASVWFCQLLFAVLTLLLTLQPATTLAAAASPAVQNPPSSATASPSDKALLLEVRGPIGPATTEYLRHGLQQASEQQAAVVILRIDTPGGLVSSLRDINRDILASPIPVIAYVAPGGAQAASAGTYIVYASHLAAMAPGTNLGAATPVAMGGAPGSNRPTDKTDKPEDTSQPASDPGSQKAINDAVAYIRSLAELRGRNADWAESAVREAASLSATQAHAQHVVEILAPDLPSLLQQADGREVILAGQPHTLATAGLEVDVLKPGWRSELLSLLTHPSLAYILLLVGIYGIIFELMNPGALFPGTLGGISLLLALLALNMLPINYAGIALLLLGIALMVAEAFVTSFGILGLAGLAAFAMGSIFIFDTGIPGFDIPWPVIAVAALASLALFAIVLTAAVRAQRRPPLAGPQTPLGESGQVLHWNHGQGQVQVHGEIWQAQGPEQLQAGQTVQVLAREGLLLTVEAKFPAPPSGTPRSGPAMHHESPPS